MSCTKIAVYPGSFDPVTNGHIDIISRGAKVFDEVVVAVACNQDKKSLFTIKERMWMIGEIFADNPKIKVATFDGLLINYVQKMNAHAIIRGLRAVSDFEYEFQMALMNRKLAPSVETFFMMSKDTYMYVSSRIVKELASLGGTVTDLVHPLVEKKIKEKHSVK
ncbi:MAG: pantetheine-phosphate adenylyltransferase [Deltaproteobacteria bacterium]|nr:pantetheine-phosphate adenylyltransferase [Candidatus Anaeroferrophillus wilburensis]MBN2888294.1 pantetheine-phosphate adenylyltransferase [Deltaproteobacteria bacterium]